MNKSCIFGALILFGCAGTTPGRPIADEGSLGHILIDKMHPAYTVVTGVPIAATSLQMSKCRQAASDKDVELLEWKAFMPEAEKRLRACIVKDEYSMKSRLGDFLYAVQNYPGTPFGLTWNGGMAFTYRDYQHAKGMYEIYRSSPGTWRKRGGRDARSDPVNPDGHLPFFLVPRKEQEKLAASP